MKTAVVTLALTLVCSTLAQNEQPKPAPRAIAFFDILDLPARIDQPKLQKTGSDFSVTCAVANRSDESLVGLRFNLLLVDPSNNRQITRLIWDEATAVPPYSIKSFALHPPLKEELRAGSLFLAIDEVITRDTIWRTVDADKTLRAYARGDHELTPRVQKLQNKFDNTKPQVIPALLPRPPIP